MTTFIDLLQRDRERAGLSIAQGASRLGVPPATYRALEAGDRWPAWATYDRICTAFGWPRSFR